MIRNAADLGDPLQYWFAVDRSQAQQQLHWNFPHVSPFMQCYKEMGQQPVFDGVAQPKPSRCAPTPYGNGKYLCQLQPDTQPACNRVSNRDQNWTPREKYGENASIQWCFPHIIYRPTHAHSLGTQIQCKEVFNSVCLECVSLVFVLMLYWQ